MPLSVSPKIRRNISRIIPFGLIWLLTGWLFSLSEALLPQNRNYLDPTDIELTLPVFLFAAFSLITLGIIVGTLEILTFQKRFLNYSFLRKISIKFFLYLCIMLLAIGITYPTAEALSSNSSFLDPALWSKTGGFLLSPLFFNALLQLAFALFLSLLYSAVSENLGHSVLLNFFTGKYHRPVIERRIFMFLDMKSSTTIAEQLGPEKYFKLLGEYYNLMSDPIINHSGEVYQYIGDEVVVTWREPQGLMNNNCIRCFFEIKENLRLKQDHFVEKYGVMPDFKAGIHIGEATTGEIGALKKEIVFTGDVLNTTSRIQGLCKEYGSDLLISGDLRELLTDKAGVSFVEKGSVSLRGKKVPTKIFECKH